MLWSFWHCVLGWVLIWKAGRWEGPVMTVVSFAQFALATMILGIYFFGAKVGSSPFALLRNEMEAPIFSRPDYLQFVKDGNGLNALLQNYWMVIHPPILFLGFASTIVPFAYAVGGYLTGDHKGWTKPALPWGVFAAAVLGLGIMMGAAWAYESLTFGGYWAWDPVENASLVPWLTLIAGIHTNLIFKNSGYSLRSTYIFYVVSFILVLYSTFLTRSGVLGDTSVHAFTDLGMNAQLFLFLNVFIWLAPLAAAKTSRAKWAALGVFVATNAVAFVWEPITGISVLAGLAIFVYLINTDKQVPNITREENLYSREFWMFIGSLIFFFSALVIIGKTSVPVFNKLAGTKIAPPQEVEYSYNSIQVWVAVLSGLLTGVTQYMRYKDTPGRQLLKKLLWPTAIAVAITAILLATVGIHYDKKGPVFQWALGVALFAAVYAVVGNSMYIWLGIKGKIRLAGASVAHVGFGMVLVGILISAGNKKVLSYNTTGISPLKPTDTETPLENTTLVKGVNTDMGRFMVTYTRDTINPRDRKRYFEIIFKEKAGKDSFNLYPDVIENNKGQEGLSANPDARHYPGKDIFAYLTFLSDPTARTKDTTSFKNQMVTIGDTMFYSRGRWVLSRMEPNPTDARFASYAGDTLLAGTVTVIANDGRLYQARPAFRVKENMLQALPDTVMSQGLVFALVRPGSVEKREMEVGVKESSAILDFVTLKAYEFPGINLLWLGVIVTVIGMLMSVVRRVQLM
jgi:cytochrome c-type biogenesis protein CcmF